jgi:hypothetical protein
MHSYLHKIFILVKSGCYKPTPLRRISPRDSGSAWEYVSVICSKIFFVFPGSFVFRVVTPLYLAHLPHDTSMGIRGWLMHYLGIHHCRHGGIASISMTHEITKFAGPHKSCMRQYIMELAHQGQTISL